jgi:hypothetical protein
VQEYQFFVNEEEEVMLTANVHIKDRDKSLVGAIDMCPIGITSSIKNTCAAMIKYVICYVLTLPVINVLDY